MKTRLPLLSLLLVGAFCSFASGQTAMPLDQAVKDGTVEAEITGIGGSTGDAIHVVVRRKVSDPLILTLTTGTVFKSVSGTVQNMLGAAIKGERVGEKSYRPGSEIILNDDDKHTYIVEAYCLDFHKGNPGPSDSFTLAPVDDRAVKILQAGKTASASIQAIQAAMWMGKEGIGAKELKERFPVTDADIEVAGRLLADSKPTTLSAPNPAPTTSPEPAILAPPKVPPQAKSRTWTDDTGKHKIDATFLELKDGKVRLQRADGRAITLVVEKLSEADQAYLKTQSEGSGSGAPSREKLQTIATSFSEQLVERLAAEYLIQYQWGKMEHKLSDASVEAIAVTTELSFEERLAWAMVSLSVPLWNNDDFAKAIVTAKVKIEIAESKVDAVTLKHLIAVTIRDKSEVLAALNKAPDYALKWNHHLTKVLSHDMTPEAANAIVRVAAIVKSSTTKELIQARKRIKAYVRTAIAEDPKVLEAYTEAEDLRKRSETLELRRERERVKRLMEEPRKKRGSP